MAGCLTYKISPSRSAADVIIIMMICCCTLKQQLEKRRKHIISSVHYIHLAKIITGKKEGQRNT